VVLNVFEKEASVVGLRVLVSYCGRDALSETIVTDVLGANRCVTGLTQVASRRLLQARSATRVRSCWKAPDTTTITFRFAPGPRSTRPAAASSRAWTAAQLWRR
jgi:hypothetical protein